MKEKKENLPPFKQCDHPDCSEEGLYRAPKDRSLSSYYWFCLKHVKEYNKKWDYYKGLSPEEIELSIRHDTVWHKPSWKLGEGGAVNTGLKDPFKLFPESAHPHQGESIAPSLPRHTSQFYEACAFMELPPDFTLEMLKKNYKKLAKKFHPDTSSIKNADVLFKKLKETYDFLLKQHKTS